MAVRAQEKRHGMLLLNAYRASVGVNEKVLERGGGDGCTTM